MKLQSLRVTSWAEGATLLLLLFIAVPLKRLAGWPEAVSIMGPVHGAAFLLYVAMVMQVLWHQQVTRRQAVLLVLAALVPLGFLMVNGIFKDSSKPLH